MFCFFILLYLLYFTWLCFVVFCFFTSSYFILLILLTYNPEQSQQITRKTVDLMLIGSFGFDFMSNRFRSGRNTTPQSSQESSDVIIMLNRVADISLSAQ